MANSFVNRDVSAHAPDSQGRRPTASPRRVHDPPHPALRPSTPSPLVAREACGLRVPHVSRAGTLQPLLLAEPPTRLPSTLQRANGGSVKTQGRPRQASVQSPQSHPEETKSKFLQGPAGSCRVPQASRGPSSQATSSPRAGHVALSVALTCPTPHLEKERQFLAFKLLQLK